MGLGSFKALGGAYAVCRLVEEHGSNITVCCASAGNHGLSVAAGAQVFGATAVVVLAESVPLAFQERLESIGCQVKRAGKTYEESVDWARAQSSDRGWIFLADSSWSDYREIPRLVMEGYTVISEELRDYFETVGSWPTHVFLQAGVGGLAGSMTWHIRHHWPFQPQIIVVEPEFAPCLKRSSQAGRCIQVEGAASNMGRLDCKEPSFLAFEILHRHANHFEVVSDQQAQDAERTFQEAGYPTTPSGAAGLAGALKLQRDLRSESRVLLILSEGPVQNSP